MTTSRILALAAITALAACDGAAGPPGPPGVSTDHRTATYCNVTAAAANDANSWTLGATCNSAADIPVEGWCTTPEVLPSTAYLANSFPSNWDDTSVPAGWSCTWGWDGTPTATFIWGAANICCATPQ